MDSGNLENVIAYSFVVNEKMTRKKVIGVLRQVIFWDGINQLDTLDREVKEYHSELLVWAKEVSKKLFPELY